ncbi:5596_t:CDS:2, partial [Racocetra persica]
QKITAREWMCKNPIEETIASQTSTYDLPSNLKKEKGYSGLPESELMKRNCGNEVGILTMRKMAWMLSFDFAAVAVNEEY